MRVTTIPERGRLSMALSALGFGSAMALSAPAAAQTTLQTGTIESPLRTLRCSQLTIKAWKGRGASATPVSWGEIYTSIKTGVIDALGHTTGIMVDQKHHEVAKNVTPDNRIGVVNSIKGP